MRHYSPLHRQAENAQRQAGVGLTAAVERERVPGFIDALDCLLALWVAEATLDADAAAGDGSGADAVAGLGEGGREGSGRPRTLRRSARG
jgi:hypothetical protein